MHAIYLVAFPGIPGEWKTVPCRQKELHSYNLRYRRTLKYFKGAKGVCQIMRALCPYKLDLQIYFYLYVIVI